MRLTRLSAAICAGVVAMSLGSAAARAEEPASEEPVVVESDMLVTEIDVAQAAKAGNRVVVQGDFRVLISGRTGVELARVPRPGTRTAEVGAENLVYGNCGSSYFYLGDYSGTDFYYRTGFSVNGSAYSYDWNGYVSGEWYSGTDYTSFDFGGGLAFRSSWTSGYVRSTQDSPNFGVWYYGRVTRGVAWLTDGRVCTSGYPNDGRYLYRY